MIVIVMGVVGVGKTTIASRLATELGWAFVDADDFHSPTSKAKIAAGIPLNDSDRAPWLGALHNEIQRWRAENRNATLACSALKQSYRDQLTKNSTKETRPVQFVYLKASAEAITPSPSRTPRPLRQPNPPPQPTRNHPRTRRRHNNW